MHNGYINIDNVKMSKSLGNFFTVRDVLEVYQGDVLRFFMLTSHYRSPINYSKDLLDSAKTSLDRIKNCKSSLEFSLQKSQDKEISQEEKNLLVNAQSIKSTFIEKMDDDLNTADAITAIFELVKLANTSVDENSSKQFIQNILSMLNELTAVLNIANTDKPADEDTSKIQELIELRNQAKKSKDFEKADKIREELRNMGIEIKDTRQGTQWSKI